MAKITFAGYDELIRANDARGRMLRERIAKALRLSAETIVSALQREERESFKAPSGEMGRILEASPEYAYGAAQSSVDVYPGGDYTGVRGKPRRAATIAFVLEHGHGDQPANPWNRRAASASKRRVNAIIEETLREGEA